MTRESDGAARAQASLTPRTYSLEVLPPFSATFPGRPVVVGLPPPPVPPSGFLDLLTAYAAPGLRGLVSCRLRSWDSPFRAFPFQESVPLSGSLLPCGWVPPPFAPTVISRFPSQPVTSRSRQGWSPSRGASSFIDSLTTVVPQAARPLARLLIRACLTPHTARPFERTGGNQF